MNLPNLLSLFRFFLTAFFVVSIVYDRYVLGLLLFVLQSVSDMLDGFLARVMRQKTPLGAYLDPMADKVMLASSYIVLLYKELVPLWLVLIVLLRDVVITLGFWVLVRVSPDRRPQPSLISKMTTVFQMVTVVLILWPGTRSLGYFFFYSTAALCILSGLQYIFIGCNALSRREIV
ncbi:MAG TPA: CDP-diacylglycerol--glycerol-3-phosphate 3-phosphatidyltransferase [Deltaproteobacteria bacterium]|nr:CDP-diacylglycerol--glycerol-3-phosphate 3-phosphatidyltransferase [Deltaproteobacteria bacterium]